MAEANNTASIDSDSRTPEVGLLSHSFSSDDGHGLYEAYDSMLVQCQSWTPKSVPAEHPSERSHEANETISLFWTSEFPEYSSDQSHEVNALCRLKAPVFKPADTDKTADEAKTCRAAVDLVAVIDISGSMSGEPLEDVKASLKSIMEQLSSNDKFALVTFHTDTEVKVHLTPMTNDNIPMKIQVIENIETHERTNLCEGLMTGMYELINRSNHQHYQTADIASVILFSDGQANEGITLKENILEEMKKAVNPPKEFAAFNGTVNTFGFGSDHDASLLSAISEQGNAGGAYHYISSKNEIQSTMQNWFEKLLSTLSRNTKLTFTSKNGSIIKAIHTPREPIWLEKGKRCEVDIGDLQSEEERDFLVEVLIPDAAMPDGNDGIADVVCCKMKYTSIISNKDVEVECSLTVNRTTSNPTTQHLSHATVTAHKNRLLVTNAMKQAQQQAEKENFSGAKQILEDAIKAVSSSVSSNNKLNQTLLSDLKNTIEVMATKETYKSHGAHYLVSMQQIHTTQRNNLRSQGRSHGQKPQLFKTYKQLRHSAA